MYTEVICTCTERSYVHVQNVMCTSSGRRSLPTWSLTALASGASTVLGLNNSPRLAFFSLKFWRRHALGHL